MARDRDTFGRALAWLREHLRDGLIRPGSPLITTDLATSLKISATPVREVLARLTGEGMLEDHRGRGVYALRLGPVEIEDHVRLHGAYIDLAFSLRRDRPQPMSIGVASQHGAIDSLQTFRARTEQFWFAIIHAADSQALAQAHRRLSDQLAVVRLIEPLVLNDTGSELNELIDLAGQGALQALQSAVLAYHHRRQAAARYFASALREKADDLQI